MRDTSSQACALVAHDRGQSRPHSNPGPLVAQEERQWERQAAAHQGHPAEERPHKKRSKKRRREEEAVEAAAPAGEGKQQHRQQPAEERRRRKKLRKQRRQKQQADGPAAAPAGTRDQQPLVTEQRPGEKRRKQRGTDQEAAGPAASPVGAGDGEQQTDEAQRRHKKHDKQRSAEVLAAGPVAAAAGSENEQQQAATERPRKKRHKHRLEQEADGAAAAPVGAGHQHQQQPQAAAERPDKQRRKKHRPEQEAAGPGAAAAGAGGQQQQEAAGPPQGALLGFLAQELGGLFGHLSAAAQQFGQTGQLPPSLFQGATAATPLILSAEQAGAVAAAAMLNQQAAREAGQSKKRRLEGRLAPAGVAEVEAPNPGTSGAAAGEPAQPAGGSKKRKAAALGPAAGPQPAEGAAVLEPLQRKKKKRHVEGAQAAAQAAGEPGAASSMPALAPATGRRLPGGEGEGALPASLAGRPGLDRSSSGAPSPQRPTAVEGGAAAAGSAGGVEYPHPDIPALLVRLADPDYKPPFCWGEAEKAHLVALVEDEAYRRHHLHEGKLNFITIDRHLKRNRTTSNKKYGRLKYVQQFGTRVRGGNRWSSLPYKARVAYALQQLPGMSGTLEQVCAKIEEHPVYGAGLNQQPDISHPSQPVWVQSMHKELSRNFEFVDTGERVKASSGWLQTVWRYCHPEPEQQEAGQQSRSSKKAERGHPFLGKHS